MVLANGIPQHGRDMISLWIVLLLSIFQLTSAQTGIRG